MTPSWTLLTLGLGGPSSEDDTTCSIDMFVFGSSIFQRLEGSLSSYLRFLFDNNDLNFEVSTKKGQAEAAVDNSSAEYTAGLDREKKKWKE